MGIHAGHSVLPVAGAHAQAECWSGGPCESMRAQARVKHVRGCGGERACVWEWVHMREGMCDVHVCISKCMKRWGVWIWVKCKSGECRYLGAWMGVVSIRAPVNIGVCGCMNVRIKETVWGYMCCWGCMNGRVTVSLWEVWAPMRMCESMCLCGSTCVCMPASVYWRVWGVWAFEYECECGRECARARVCVWEVGTWDHRLRGPGAWGSGPSAGLKAALSRPPSGHPP